VGLICVLLCDGDDGGPACDQARRAVLPQLT